MIEEDKAQKSYIAQLEQSNDQLRAKLEEMSEHYDSAEVKAKMKAWAVDRAISVLQTTKEETPTVEAVFAIANQLVAYTDIPVLSYQEAKE
jgi:hypothetical protein